MKKSDIRKIFKAKRSEASKDELAKWSRTIFENCVSEFDLEGKSVSIFLPIERFQEINTWHFVNQVSAQFYLPVIRGNDDLQHIRYEALEQIKTSDWGIPEPTYGDNVGEEILDFVLVPLLAIDKKGYRTGYGKGFYDRFLSKCRPDCQFIGLSYFEPIEKIEDLHPNDIGLQFCVTPSGIIRF